MSRIYTNQKVFRFGDKLNDLLEGRVTAPLHIRLKPTNRCNHRCSYCCYRNESLFLSELVEERDEIPREKMREIVSDLGAMGVRAVTFSGGGEPLLYPHFEETARGLIDAGVKVAVLTNGALLRGAAAQTLARGAAWTRVSMDGGLPETYSQSRGTGLGELDKVCDNIRDFARIEGRVCVLGINYIVTRENHEELFGFLERMKSVGADHVKVSEAVTSTTLEGNQEYMAPLLTSVKSQIARARVDFEDDTFAIVDKIHDDFQPGNQYEKAYRRCPFMQCLTIVAADQNVYACQDKAYTKSGLLGSIHERSFRDLWRSDELRRRLEEMDPKHDCPHHCVAHEKNLMLLDYLEADPGHLEFV